MDQVNSQNSYIIKRKEVDLRQVTYIVLAVTIFLSIGPFFAWSTFASGVGEMLFKLLQVASILLMLLQLLTRKIPHAAFLGALSVLGIFIFYCFFTGVKSGTTHPLLIGNILVYAFYALNVLVDRELLVKSYSILRTIFAVVLAYTIVIHVLLLMRMPLPYAVLQSGEAGRVEFSSQFYQNYFGCLLINQGGELMYRFTSVFTEPGVVGTFCAFFLASSGLQLKKSKKDVLFLVSGLLSFSVAFYVMLVLIIAMKALRRGGYRLFAALAALMLVYIVFVNVNFNNAELSTLQNRLMLTETGLSGDNRIKEDAELAYQAFLDSDVKTVLLGYGYPDVKATQAAWQATASYKESVYCLGVLGYGLMIAWFILTPLKCYKAKDKKQNYAMYSYMLIFLVSQYQRPYMKALFLAYILLAGCLYARQSVAEGDPLPLSRQSDLDSKTA